MPGVSEFVHARWGPFKIPAVLLSVNRFHPFSTMHFSKLKKLEQIISRKFYECEVLGARVLVDELTIYNILLYYILLYYITIFALIAFPFLNIRVFFLDKPRPYTVSQYTAR